MFLRGPILLVGVFLAHLLYAQCERPKHEVNESLGHYVYDNSAEVQIGHYTRPQLQTYFFSVYHSSAYRFHFDRTKCDPNVVVQLYRTNKKQSEKELVYDSSRNPETYKDLPKGSRYYMVEVVVPPESDPGCMGILVGFYTGSDIIGPQKKKTPKIRFKD